MSKLTWLIVQTPEENGFMVNILPMCEQSSVTHCNGSGVYKMSRNQYLWTAVTSIRLTSDLHEYRRRPVLKNAAPVS